MAQTWVREGRHLNREQIIAYNKRKFAKPTNEEVAKEAVVKSKTPKEEPKIDPLDGLRAEYLEKVGSEVPNRYKNDPEWIKSKLNS